MVKQELFSDTQTFKIDIDKIYTTMIQEIDKIRSNVSMANNPQLKAIISSTNSTNPSQKSLLSQVSTDINNSQESRCHAFFRLLGLPVYEPNGTFYSPGINRESDKNANFNKYKKLVASGIPKDLYSLMDNREISINNYLQIFSVQDINASVLTLSSSRVRKFSIIPTSNSGDPFNSDQSAQSYTFDETTNINGNNFLTDYQDINNNKPSGKVLGFLQKRSHIIAPFMVDPRVELTVNPPYAGSPTNNNTAICKIIGAPFALDKSQLLFTENIYAVRPIIETICLSRLTNASPESALSQRFQDILDYIKNTDVVKDSELLNKAVENPTQTKEDQVFVKYINIIRAMIDKLVDSINTIIEVESNYHWVPIPDKKGPEFGSATQGIIIGDDLNSDKDNKIIESIINNEIDQINSQSTQTIQPDLGNFVDFEKKQPSPDDQTTDAMGNRNQNELDDMTNKRNEKTDAANNAIREIEIIMGEFSGLGLCDIIAVYLALWIIDKDTLVGMIDNESFNRLAQFPNLQSSAVKARKENNGPTAGNDIVNVMKRFEQKVVEIYALMDKLMIDRISNNSQTNI